MAVRNATTLISERPSYMLSLAVTCSENVYVRPWLERNSNTKIAIWVMRRETTAGPTQPHFLVKEQHCIMGCQTGNGSTWKVFSKTLNLFEIVWTVIKISHTSAPIRTWARIQVFGKVIATWPNMTQSEHGHAIYCRPEVDNNVISGRNVKTFERYRVVNFWSC